MPRKTTQSSMFSDLQGELVSAHEEHKDAEVDYGSGGNLPAGIEGGVAQLRDCRCSRYQKGALKDQWFFLARGVVVYPETVIDPKNQQQITITNMSTMIMEPICDTPDYKRKTIADHYGHVRNELLKLGAAPSSVTPQTVEKVCAALKKEQPHFQFRTWVGEKQELEIRNGKFFVGKSQYKSESAAKIANPYLGREPRVREEWRGKCDPPQEVPKEALNGLVDEVEENAPEAESQAAETSSGVDLLELVSLADNQNSNAAEEIQKLALAAGVTQEEINGAESWRAVAAMFKGGRDSEPNESLDLESLGWSANEDNEAAIEELMKLAKKAGLDEKDYATWPDLAEALQPADSLEPNEDPVVDIGKVVSFRGKTPGGRLTKKVIEVEITAADDDGTFTVRNLDTDDTIEGVEREQLLELV